MTTTLDGNKDYVDEETESGTDTDFVTIGENACVLECSCMHLGAVLGPQNFFLWTRISYAHYPIYRIFLCHWRIYTDFIIILRYDDVVY